jgi:hypothetical protein
VSDFPGYYLYHRQSTAGVACIHGIHRSTLLQIPAQEWKTISGRQQQVTPPVAETRWSTRCLSRWLTIFQNLNSAAQL